MSRRPKPAPPAPDLTEPDRPEAAPASTAGRMALRLDELAASLGVSRRTIERERSAGRFPRPDLHIGKAPLC